MNRFAALGRRLCVEESGVTSIEYALIALLIATGIVGTVATLGQTVREVLYQPIVDAFPND